MATFFMVESAGFMIMRGYLHLQLLRGKSMALTVAFLLHVPRRRVLLMLALKHAPPAWYISIKSYHEI
jgi:hypothetical protein